MFVTDFSFSCNTNHAIKFLLIFFSFCDNINFFGDLFLIISRNIENYSMSYEYCMISFYPLMMWLVDR